MYNFQPLRVRAFLQSGIISNQHLPLDGVLYAQAVREQIGEQVITVPLANVAPSVVGLNLPIRKENEGNNMWFYKASFAQWPDNTLEASQAYAKRFDLNRSDIVYFGKKKPHVDNQRGHFKAYHINVYYRHACYVDWYLDADKSELLRLLKFCTHLGKKTVQGWGSVLRWEVDEWPEDWSVRGENNKLMRAIPDDNGIVAGIRPSYWLPSHQFRCLLPD